MSSFVSYYIAFPRKSVPSDKGVTTPALCRCCRLHETPSSTPALSGARAFRSAAGLPATTALPTEPGFARLCPRSFPTAQQGEASSSEGPLSQATRALDRCLRTTASHPEHQAGSAL